MQVVSFVKDTPPQVRRFKWHAKLYTAKVRKRDPNKASWRLEATIFSEFSWSTKPPKSLRARAEAYCRDRGIPLVEGVRHGQEVPLSAVELFTLCAKEQADEGQETHQ